MRQAIHAAAVIEILRDIEMRKQPRILKHAADPASVRGNVNPRIEIIEHIAVERDAAAIRPLQTRDHVDDRRLAGAGCAEQAGDATVALERHIEREVAELFGCVETQHVQFPCKRKVARRASHSDITKATIAMTTETITSRRAAVSPSGVWISE